MGGFELLKMLDFIMRFKDIWEIEKRNDMILRYFERETPHEKVVNDII